MVDKSLSSNRVLKLYFTLYFYTFGLMIILLLFKIHISILDIIKSIIPCFELSLWYISVYIMLILLSPLLQKILTFNQKFLKNIY